MYDSDDRERDNRRLEHGEGLLDLGHETPSSTVQDARPDEILTMPPYSGWPVICALTLAGMFAMLLLVHYLIAAGFAVLGLLALMAWHSGEAPE